IFLNTNVTKKDFDKNVGDQTSTVTLNETISFQAVAYAKQDITDFAQTTMQGKIGQDQTLAANGITTNVTNVKQKDDKHITASITIDAKIYGTLETSQLAQTIKGESFSKASNFLGNQSQVSHVDITLQPNLFFLPHTLPRNEK